MPDVEVTVTTTPIDVYINSDPTVYIDTATQGVQGPSAPTGDFISRSETGLFYPASNPSGFVPSDQPIFEARPQVEQIGGALLGLAYVTEVGDKLPIANDFAQVVKWNGYEWVAQRVDASEIDNLNIPPDRVPAYSNNGDALFWNAPPPLDPTEGNWIGRKITTGDISGLSLFVDDYFKIGGNSKGQSLSLGTNDANDLNFETSGATRMSISKNGIITVGGTDSQRIYFDTTVAGSPQIRWSGAIPNQGSRLTSKDGGGSWVTLDRVDGSAENLNIVGNLQVGTGVGIRSQRLYIRGNALITEDLTVNTSGNFLSGLFVNRIPVLTGTSGTQSQINNLSTSLSGSYVTLGTNQTITGNKIFDSNVFIKNLTVTGTQTIINTETINLASNFLNLNATGGVRDGGLFINLSSNSGSGAYLGWDIPSNTWRFGSGFAGTDLATLDYIASQSWVTGKLNESTIVRTTGNQTIFGDKDFFNQINVNTINVTGGGLYAGTNVGLALDSNSLIISDSLFQYGIIFQDGTSFNLNGPNGNIDLYNGIITGFGNIYQNSYRVVDSSQTGNFLTNASNVVYLTGNQTVSGLKTFANNLEVSGYGNFSDNLYINNSRVATEAELTKKMIAFAIALG